MRNLKKVLSLVLCMAMMFSIMVMGAGAAFSDAKDVKNKEAVDACVALNIINGYEDGSFRPEGSLIRAEAAKMISIAINSGKDVTVNIPTKPTFSDVRNNQNVKWAEKYIEFGVSNGFIAGMGDGTFQPATKLTGTDLAKMLLVVLGYDAKAEGLAGTTEWDINTNMLASKVGIYNGLNIDPAKAISRDDASKMVWNTLNAKTVIYLTGTTGAIKTDKTLLKAEYNATVVEAGHLTDVAQNPNGTYKLTVNDKTYNNVAKDYSDLIGLRTMVIKAADETVIGVFAHQDCTVVAQGSAGQMEVDTAKKTVKLNGAAYELDKDYNNSVVANAAKSDLIKLIDVNGNGKVDRAVKFDIDVVKVTNVTKSAVYAGSTSYKFADNKIADGIAADDYVVVTKNVIDGAKPENVINKADVVSGKVTGIDGDKYCVNGTWYKLAAGTAPTINTVVDLVVYDGMIFNADSSVKALNVAVVTGVGNYQNMDKVLPVKLMFQDGKEETVNVAKWDGSAAITGNVNVMVSYTVKGDKYELTTVNTGAIANTDFTGVKATGMKYVAAKGAIDNAGTAYGIASDAMVVLYNTVTEKYTYMTGADLLAKNDITFAGDAFLAVKDHKVAALFAETKDAITAGDTLYGYVTKVTTGLNSNDETVSVIDVVVNGEKLTNIVTNDKNGQLAVGNVISYIMSDGEAAVTVENGAITAAITAINGKFITIDDINTLNKRLVLTDKSVVIAIETNDDGVKYVDNKPVVAGKNADGNFYKNAKYIVDSKDNIELMIVETSGDKDIK